MGVNGRCFRGLFFALLLLQQLATAQNAHKFVAPPDRGAGNPLVSSAAPNTRQEVLQIELARLQTADGDVPIAVAAEVDRLSLFWWDRNVSSWRHWQRLHKPVAAIGLGAAKNLRQLNWSNRVGLAAGDGIVYLVYRRNPLDADGRAIGDQAKAQIFIDQFEWDAASGSLLTPNDLGIGPVQLPLQELGHPDTGFYLWAGWDAPNSQLVVLFQSVSTSSRYAWIPGKRPRGYLIPWQLGELPEIVPSDPSIPGIDLPKPPAPPGPREGRAPRAVPAPDRNVPQTGAKGAILVPPVPALPTGQPIVIQTVTTSLVLMASPAAGADLARVDNWYSPPFVVGEGGYDFDARLDSGKVHVVYRKEPYSIGLGDVPRTGDYRAELIAGPGRASLLAPLLYRQVDLATMTTTKAIDAIPGGDSPQIQWLDPLQISVDRPVTGAIVFGTAPSGTRTTKADWTKVEKVWLEDAQNGTWYQTRLFALDPRFVLRKTLLSNLPQFVAEDDGVARSAATYRIRPLYLVGEPQQGHEKQRELLLLMQVLKYDSSFGDFNPRGFLGRLRFSLRDGTASVLDWHVTDYSHKQINAVDASPEDETPPQPSFRPRGGENLQFAPVTYVNAGQRETVANTVGGALVVEPSSGNPLSFFAYNDLGDGGLRVIFKADGLTPGGLVPVPKSEDIPIAAVGGAGTGDDVMAQLAATGWTASELPGYPLIFDFSRPGRYRSRNDPEPGSLASGLHPVLDSYLLLAEAAGASGDSIVVDQYVNDEMQAAVEVAMALGGVDASVSAEEGFDLVSNIRVSTGAPWLTQSVDMDGSSSYGRRFALTSYQWKLEGPLAWITETETGDELEEPYWTGPEIALSTGEAASAGLSRTLSERGTYRVTLTVGDTAGMSVYSAGVETTVGALPGPPRSVRGQIIASSVGPSTIQLTWSAPLDAGSQPQSYNVYQVSGSSRTPVDSTTTATLALNFSTAGLTEGVQYKYAVTAVLDGQEGPASPSVGVLVRNGAGNVSISSAAHDINRVRLIWSGPFFPPSDITLLGYRIYRRAPYQAQFSRVAELGLVTLYVDSAIRREEAYEYVVAARLRTSAGSEMEGSWSSPLTARPSNDAVPLNVALTEPAAGGVRTSWAAPSTTEAIAGYRVFRARRGGSTYARLNATDLPSSATSYTDATATAGETYSYVVAAVGGTPHTKSASQLIEASEIWDHLWAMMEDMSGEGEMAKLVDLQLIFGKYVMSFTRRDPRVGSETLPNGLTGLRTIYNTRQIEIETLPEWLTDYRFLSNTVENRFAITIHSDNVAASNSIAPFVDIHSVTVKLNYIRPYTLGVFMADERTYDPTYSRTLPADDALWVERTESGTGRRLASVLGAKPIGDSKIDVDSVAVDLSLTATGRIIVNIAFLAGLLALGALVALIAWAVGMTLSLNPAAVAIGLFMLVMIANSIAEPLIERAVESRIGGRIGGTTTKTALDASPLMVYAGEGLAEAIARKALREPAIALNPGDGRDRYREQFWQMVIVEPGKAALWARK